MYIVRAVFYLYFPHNVQTEAYVNNIFIKLLITNNIWKNVAAAARAIVTGNVLKILFITSDSRQGGHKTFSQK